MINQGETMIHKAARRWSTLDLCCHNWHLLTWVWAAILKDGNVLQKDSLSHSNGSLLSSQLLLESSSNASPPNNGSEGDYSNGCQYFYEQEASQLKPLERMTIFYELIARAVQMDSSNYSNGQLKPFERMTIFSEQIAQAT